MPVYNKLYMGRFANLEVDPDTNLSLDVDIKIDIYDTTSGEADEPTEIIELPMAENPCTIEIIDNEEDKFKSVIRSKRALINIHSSDTLGIETFVDGGDHRFYCEIYSTDLFLSGYISVADIQEDFLPDPNVITLIATDGLGFLEDKELVDFDGNTPSGVKPIGLILQWALQAGSGQALGLSVALNIRDESASTLNSDISGVTGAGHFFMFNYLDLRTFEGDDPGARLTCAEVIRKILFSLGAELSQQKGRWTIKRIDELQSDSNIYYALFDEFGAFNIWETETPGNFIKSIGAGLSLSWMNDDALVSTDRPLRRIELKRNYEFFSEMPCNSELERGDVISAPDLTAANSTGTYEIECWKLARQFSQPVNTTARLERKFEFGYEKERYVVVEPASSTATPWAYLRSEAIPVEEGARINISVPWRFSGDFGAGEGAATYQPIRVYILGDNGDVYTWWHPSSSNPNDYYWYGPLTEPGERSIPDTFNLNDTDESIWRTVSVNSVFVDSDGKKYYRNIPVKGKLYIGLNQMHQGEDSGDNQEGWFGPISVEYIPRINGSYSIYTGERHSVEQTGDNVALRQDEVFIGTGPDPNVKGCILKRGEDSELYSGSADFGTSHDIQISGNKTSTFEEGQRIIITGSGSGNNLTGNVVSVSYSLIGNLTTIITDMDFTLEAGATVVISLVNYKAANLFYSAGVLPDGAGDPSNLHPLGHLIVFDFWNQYNRVMRKFEGTIDGLNSNLNPVDLIYLYSLTDANPNTGTKVFMILHYSQDLHLCEMQLLLVEVHDPAVGKNYENHTFKYLTK